MGGSSSSNSRTNCSALLMVSFMIAELGLVSDPAMIDSLGRSSWYIVLNARESTERSARTSRVSGKIMK